MIIVGLGNPGEEYQNTHHNIGFMFLDYYVNSLHLTYKYLKTCNALVATTVINNTKHYFVKPLTYMNLSGQAVIKVMKYYQLDISDLLVIHDDLDLPLGKVRIRTTGSSGGHKGMASIIDHLKTKDINRIRIGIDRSDKMDVIDFVLTKFTKSEMQIIEPILNNAVNICHDYIYYGINYIMNHYNG